MQLPAKEHTGSHLLALHGVLVFPYHCSTHRHLKGKVEYTLYPYPYPLHEFTHKIGPSKVRCWCSGHQTSHYVSSFFRGIWAYGLIDTNKIKIRVKDINFLTTLYKICCKYLNFKTGVFFATPFMSQIGRTYCVAKLKIMLINKVWMMRWNNHEFWKKESANFVKNNIFMGGGR